MMKEYEELQLLAIAIGNSVHASKFGLKREQMSNRQWVDILKDRCLRGIHTALSKVLNPEIAINFITTPYNTKIIGKGKGINEMILDKWGDQTSPQTISILADVVDGSWNVACGVPWSASTMLAMTDIMDTPHDPGTFTLADFKCGLIIPLIDSGMPPESELGFFYGVEGQQPKFRHWNSTKEDYLFPTDITDVRQTRFFLDLFTTQTYESLALSIAAVGPLIYDWADIARFYGAGIEMMSLLGRLGITPGFGGYVAANQKSDNLIPTKLLLEGAGLIVTDWWNNPIDNIKIMDRTYVAIAANKPLHDHMIRHLSRIVRLP